MLSLSRRLSRTAQSPRDNRPALAQREPSRRPSLLYARRLSHRGVRLDPVVAFLALHQNLYRTQRSCGSQRSAVLGGGLLHLEQEILVIPIPAAAPEHGADVAVDGLDRAERDLLVAVGEDTVEVSQQELGDLAEGRQALPPERAEPRREKAPGGPLIGVVPEMGELLLEQVGFGEAPVERQQL